MMIIVGISHYCQYSTKLNIIRVDDNYKACVFVSETIKMHTKRTKNDVEIKSDRL